MKKKYAIIDNQGGWLVNLVLWNGNIQTWQPPTGTTAILIEQINFSSLPKNPQELNDPVETLLNVDNAGTF
jgi:hypothetical protein